MFGKFKGWFSALSTAGRVGFIASLIVAGSIVNAASHPTTPPKAPEAPPTVQGDKVEHKTITTTEAVAFDTKTVDDPDLTSGTDQTQTEGVNGIKTKTYDVTSTNGTETSRTLTKEEVTTPPITKIINHGTYVAPAPAAAAYRVGATCVDGSPSSATGSGACSHHHGVSCWQYSDGTCRSY